MAECLRSHTALPRWAIESGLIVCWEAKKVWLSGLRTKESMAVAARHPVSRWGRWPDGPSSWAVIPFFAQANTTAMVILRHLTPAGTPPGARKRSGKNLVFPREPGAASPTVLMVILPKGKITRRQCRKFLSEFPAVFTAVKTLAPINQPGPDRPGSANSFPAR